MTTSVRMHKKASLLGLCFLLVLVLLFVWYANVRATQTYSTCAEIKVYTGRAYIPRGDPLYNPALDRNHDGVACQE